MTILLPDSPIGGDLTPGQIADLIDQAAALIETDGLEIGDLWPDSKLQPYEPGVSACIAGALAVVCGYRRADEVEEGFTATAPLEAVGGVPWTPHLVFAAVLAELEFKQPEDLFDWSDGVNSERLVVEALRDAAQKIRARGAVAA